MSSSVQCSTVCPLRERTWHTKIDAVRARAHSLHIARQSSRARGSLSASSLCIPSRMAFAVHRDMRRWAAAPTDDGTHTILLAAFLTPFNRAASQQIGSFLRSARRRDEHLDLVREVAIFVDSSAAALASGHVTVHIVHDTDMKAATIPSLPCIRFHRFAFGDDAAETSIRSRAAATDRRWPLYARILRQKEAHGEHWDCAWAIDLTDVVMLQLPPCGALPEDRLAIGNDGQHGSMRNWFKWLGAQANANRWWVGIEQWLKGAQKPVLNNGIVGGRKAAIEPFLHFSSRAVVTFWTRQDVATNWSIDMLVSNQGVYDENVRAEAGAAVAFPITGFPYGPVHLPMWGLLGIHRGRPLLWDHNRSDAFETPTDNFAEATLALATNASFLQEATRRRRVSWWCSPKRFHCRRRYVNSIRGLFWFGHKMPKIWLENHYGLRRPAPLPPARCTVSANDAFVKLHEDAACCLRDQGTGEGVSKSLLHVTINGYTGGNPVLCHELCTRLGCAAFSHKVDWQKCVFCGSADCPFSRDLHNRQFAVYANHSTVWRRVAKA